MQKIATTLTWINTPMSSLEGSGAGHFRLSHCQRRQGDRVEYFYCGAECLLLAAGSTDRRNTF
jgi:hypothetical protein